jgi:hypothetical protein
VKKDKPQYAVDTLDGNKNKPDYDRPSQKTVAIGEGRIGHPFEGTVIGPVFATISGQGVRSLGTTTPRRG